MSSFAYVISVLLVLTSCIRVKGGSDAKIIGGETAQARRFMASILDEGSTYPFCGGALIAKNIVLTAAHCVSDPKKRLVVGLGQSDASVYSSPGFVPIKVKAIKVHEGYFDSIKHVDYDIALLLLEDYDAKSLGVNVQPIQIADNIDQAEKNGEVTVIGWGNSTSVGTLLFNELREVTVPVVPVKTCDGSYKGAISDRQICAAAAEGGLDSCQGDSGGPLVIRNRNDKEQLVGIVSWGEGCAQKGAPGVYTRVAKFRGWINANIDEFEVSDDKISGNQVKELVSRFCYKSIEDSVVLKGEGTQTNIIHRYKTLPGAVMTENAAISVSNLISHCDFTQQNGSAFKTGVVAIPSKKDSSEQTFALAVTHLSSKKTYSTPVTVSQKIDGYCAHGGSGFGYINFDLNDLDSSNIITTNGKSFFATSHYSGDSQGDLVFSCKAESSEWSVIRIKDAGGLAKNILSVDSKEANFHQKFEISVKEPTDQLDQSELYISFSAERDNKRKMKIVNESSETVYSWKLSCNFQMDLPSAKSINGQSLDPTEKYSWIFMSPNTGSGTIKAKGFVDLEANSVGTSEGTPVRACKLNGRDIIVIFDDLRR